MTKKRFGSHRTIKLTGAILAIGIGLQGCSLLSKDSQTEAAGQSKPSNEAENQEEALTEREKQTFQSIYFEGVKNKAIGNTRRAVKQFRKALGINPAAEAAHYELSRLLEKQKAGDSAVMHARKAVALSDSSYWYLKHLGGLYRDHNRYGKAAQVMEQITKEHEEGPKFYYQLANVYIRQNKLDKALQTYKRFEENFGVDPQIVRQQKRIYLQKNEVEKAADAVRGLIEQNPNQLRYYRQLAKLYSANDRPEKAKGVYEEMVKLAPDDGQTQMALAQYYSKQGKPEKAFDNLKKAFEDASLDVDRKVKFMLSNYLQQRLNSKQTQQAFELGQTLVEAHPESAKAHAAYGDVLYRNDRPTDAMQEYEAALASSKDNFSVWQNLLQIYLQESRYQKLERQSSRALTYFPNQPLLYYFHGLGLKENGKTDKAVKQFESGLNLVSGNRQLKTQLYSNLGMTYHDMADYQESEKYFDKALELNPGDPFILNNYSWYLALRGDKLSKAEKMSAKSLEKQPNNSAYLDTYGWIQYKKGNYQKAEKYIKRALEQNPEDPELLEHYGDVLYKLDQIDKATKYWKQARNQGGPNDELSKKIRNRRIPK